MNRKPGIMIYFDMRRVLPMLTNEEKGILFETILEYGETKCVGQMPDNIRLLWPLVQMRLDNDEMRYHKVCVKRQYAAYVRWAKKHGEEPEDYCSWKLGKGYDLMEEDEYDLAEET